MPSAGKVGNKGNVNGAPRKWIYRGSFGAARIPKPLMPDIYKIAFALDKDPGLTEKIHALIELEAGR